MLVDLGVRQPLSKIGGEEEVIQPQARITPIGIPEIIPEREDPLLGMHHTKRVRPALSEKVFIGIAHFDAEKRIVRPALRLVDVIAVQLMKM